MVAFYGDHKRAVLPCTTMYYHLSVSRFPPKAISFGFGGDRDFLDSRHSIKCNPISDMFSVNLSSPHRNVYSFHAI